jgi:tetratricopeptide (TPR) repeat protein
MSEFESLDVDRLALHQAEASFRCGRLRDAFVTIQPYLEDQPDCGRGWELLGLIRHNWRQWEAALAALEEASIRIPLSAAAECALGDCYLAVDRQAWSRPLYRNVVQRKLTTVSALLSAASGLDALNEPQTAIVACRRAITLDPEVAQPYFDLSYYLRRCGASTRTIEAAAQRAISLEPDNLKFRLGLAGYLHSLERSSEAMVLLAPLTMDQIRSVYCHGCLGRLLELFAAVGDDERAECCRQQQESLDHSGETGEC